MRTAITAVVALMDLGGYATLLVCACSKDDPITMIGHTVLLCASVIGVGLLVYPALQPPPHSSDDRPPEL